MSASEPAFFIDFEGFQPAGESEKFDMKELCILGLSDPISSYCCCGNESIPHRALYYLFRKEGLYQCDESTRVQTRFIHQLRMEEGHSRYCNTCIMFHLQCCFPNCMNGIFYVLDAVNGAKIRFLKREFPELRFVNINGLAFKTLPFTRIQCPYRKHGAHCAFIKAHQLFDHYFAVD